MKKRHLIFQGNDLQPVSMAVWVSLLMASATPFTHAGTWTWNGADGGVWGSASNWNPASIPTSSTSTQIVFAPGHSGLSIQNYYNLSVGSITFDASALASTIQVNSLFVIGGAGITNNSSSTQTLQVLDTADLAFTNSAGAGNVAINVGSAANLSFNDSSSAGSATINLNGTSMAQFWGSASAGSATLIASGANSWVEFGALSSGGNASVDLVNATSVLDISSLNTSSTTLGSLAGSGAVALGGKNLTVGGNNQSTTFSGSLADGGQTSGSGGSLTKAGNGTLTLSGSSTYTGATLVNSGILAVSGSLTGTSSIGVDSATVQFSGTSSAGYTPIHATGWAATVDFFNTTNAGHAAISASGTNSSIQFQDTSSGSNSTLTLSSNGSAQFWDSSTAGAAIINATTPNAAAMFFNTSSAGNANITASGDGAWVRFSNSSTAGNATINASGEASLVRFFDSSAAGNAKLSASGPSSYITFEDSATGDNASVYLGNALSSMNISQLTGNSMTLGSLLGRGTMILGGKNLTVGSDDTSTEFSGSVVEGGSVSGGSLTKTGTGTLTLSGSNSYSGGTIVNGGVLQIASDAALGAVPASPATNLTLNGGMLMNTSTQVSLSPNRSIDLGVNGGYIEAGYQISFNVNGQISIYGQISGVGGLGIAWDCGAVVLGGSNSYAGATTIGTTNVAYWNNAQATPTLRLGNSNALPGTNLIFGRDLTNTVTLDMNGYNATVAALNGGTNAVVTIVSGNSGSTSTLTAGNNNASSTFQGRIRNTTGTVSLKKIGTGTLALTGTNTYSGGTTVSGGVLQINSDAQLGTVPASPATNLTLNGGLLMNNGAGVTLNATRNISLGANGGYIDATTASPYIVSIPFAINGQISGVGGLGIAWDGGTVILNGHNTYEGATTVGTTAIQYWNNPGAMPTLKLGSSNALPGTNLIFGTGLNITATLDMNGFDATVAALSGNSCAIVDMLSSGGTGTLSVGNQDASSTFQGRIMNNTGMIGLTKIGAGTLTLSGINSYDGPTQLNGGTLSVGSSAALDGMSTIHFGGGTLQYTGANTFDYSNHFSVADNQQYRVDTNGQNVTWATALTSSGGSLTKIGAGTLTLTGSNTYTQGTTLSGGQLTVNQSQGLGSGTVTLTGSDADHPVALNDALANSTLAVGDLTLNGFSTLGLQSNASIQSTGAITINGVGNTIALGGNAWNSGTSTLLFGTSLEFGSGAAISLTGATLNNQTLNLGDSTSIGRTTYSFGSNSNSLFLQSSTVLFDLVWNGATNNQWDTTSPNWQGSVGGLNPSGSNIAFVAVDNVYFTSASTSIVVTGSGVQAGEMLVSNASGTVDLGGGSIAANNITKTGDGDLMLANALSLTGTFENTGNGSVTLSGALTDGALIQNGAGTLTLTAVNHYAGGTTLNAGTLSFASGALGSTGTVDITGNSTLQWHGSNTQDISGRLKIENGVTATLDTHGNDVTFASSLQTGTNQTGALTKAGAGTLTLTGANLYTGGTTISAGTLQLGDGSALNGSVSGNITDNAALVFANPNAQSYGGVISGSGTLSKVGAGTLTLTGTNTYSGGTTVSGGCLLISSDAQLGVVPDSPAINITLNNGLLMNNASVVTLNVNRNIYLGTGGGFIDPGYTDPFTVNGQMSGVGGLGVAWDGGMVVLKGSNSYAGATTIGTTAIKYWSNSGATPTLQLGNSNALPGTDLIFGTSLANTATLDMNGYNATIAALSGSTHAVVDILSGNGTSTLTVGNHDASSSFQGVIRNSTGTLSVSKIGAGTLTLTGANIYTGATTIHAGTLSFAQGALDTTGTVDFAGNSSLQWNGANTQDLSSRMKIEDSVTATLDTHGNDVTFASSLQTGTNHTCALTKTGAGTLTLTAANSFTGATTVSAGTLQVSGGGAIAQTNGILVDSITPATDATLTVAGVASRVTTTGTLVVGQYGTGTVNITSGGSVTNSGNADIGLELGANGTVTVAGTGSVWTSNALVVGLRGAGTLTLLNGGVVAVAGSEILALAGGAGSTGTLNIGNGSGAGTLQATVVTGVTGTAIVNFNHSDPAYRFLPQITGNIAVYQIGSGKTILTDSNTYTGGTILNAGMLSFAHGALGSTGTVDFTGNSTLQWNGTNTQDVSGRLKIEDGVTATLDTQGNGVTFASTLQTGTNQTGALTKTGAGMLALTATNHYTGGTVLNEGTLSFVTGALGATGTVDITGNSTLQWNGSNVQDLSSRLKIEDGVTATVDTHGNDVTFSSTLQTGTNQTGSLTKAGAGTLGLAAANNYTGVTTLSAGILNLANQNAVQNSTVMMTGGSLVFDSSVIGDGFTLGGLAASASGPGYDIVLLDNASTPNPVALSVGNNSANTAYAGTLSGTGSLIKIGTGTLTLTAVNSHAGGTTLNAGMLSFANGALGAAGTVDFIGNSTLQWNGSNVQDLSGRLKIEDGITATLDTNGNDVTFANTLQTGTNHAGALTKIGAGTLVLTAVNNYAGGTTLNAGTLSFANGALGTPGTVDFTGNSTLQWNGSNAQDISAWLKIEDGVTATVDTSGNDITFASALQTGTLQTGALTKIGAGALVLTAVNNYTGGTNINAGTLSFANGALGTAGTVDFTGSSSLQWNGSNTQDVSSRLKIEDGITATVDTNGIDVTFASALQTGIAQTGSLTKTGTGTLTLTAVNNYAGTTTVNAGMLLVSAGAALMQTAGILVDSVAPASNASLTVDGTASNILSMGGVTVGNSGTGTLNLQNGGAMAVGGGAGIVTLASGAGSSGTFNIGNGTGTLNAAVVNGGAGTAVVNIAHGDPAYVFAPQLAGSLAVNLAGSGTTVLTAANSYTGTTTLSAGILNLSNQNAVQNSTVMLTGGSLVFDSSVSGDALTLGGLAASASGPGHDIVLLDNASTPNPVALSVGNNSADTAYAGVLSGTGSLIKIGTGTLTLTAVNSYAGGTTLNAGMLSFANGALGAAGTVDFTGNSTLQWHGSNVQDLSGRLKIEDGVTATVDTNGNDITFASTLQTGTNHAGALTKIGAGTLVLTAVNNYAGGTTLNAGTLSFTAGALGTLGTVDFTGNSTLQWHDSNDQDLSGRMKVEDGVTATVDINGNVITFASTLQTGTLQTGALTKTGTGTLVLTAVNNHKGGTNINAGMLSFANGSLGTTGTVDFTGNTSLQWNGTNTQDISSRLKIEDGITATVDTNGNDMTFAGVLLTGTSQTGALAKAGTGMLTLTAANVYMGATTVSAGTLQVSGGGALTQTSGISVDSVVPATNATLTVDGTSSSVTSIGDGTIGGSGTGTLNIQNGGVMNLGGSGTGILALASNAHSAGTLNIGNGGGVGTLNAAAVTGGDGTAIVNFDHGDSSYTFVPNISGSIAVYQIGSGTSILAGTDTYTGATTVSAGTLQVSGGGTLTQTSSITVDSAAPATHATFTVAGAASSVTSNGNLIVGNSGTGTVGLTNGGSLSNKASAIGSNAGSTGTMTVDGTGSLWSMTDTLYVGNNGSGTLNVTNGGAITTRPPWAGGYGADIYVGNNGSGTLNITSGGSLTDGVGYIGYNAGSNGTVTVDGAGSTWKNNTALSQSYVGYSGSGTLNITHGGGVLNQYGIIGYSAGSNGTVTVDGNGSTWSTNGTLIVSNHGTATLNITDGGTVTNTSAVVGNNGTVNVDGNGSTWTNGYLTPKDNDLVIGGTLNITHGGSVTNGDGEIAGTSGVVNVDGANSAWSNGNNLRIYESGTLNITTGGSVTDGTGSIGYLTTSGTVNVDGANATLTCASGHLGLIASDSTLSIDSGSTLNITHGGLVQSGDGSVGGNSTVTVDGTGSAWKMKQFLTSSTSGDFDLDVSGGGQLSITNGGVVTDCSGTIESGGTVLVDGAGSTWYNSAGVGAGLSIDTGTLTIQNQGVVYANKDATGLTSTSVIIGNDILGGTGTLNLLTGGVLHVTSELGGPSGALMLGNCFGDTGVVNIGNGAGAGVLDVDSIQNGGFGNGTINFNHNESSYQFQPGIAGTLTINQIGTGKTILTAANSYIGTTTITAGTLQLQNSSATGASTVTMNGGSLVFDSSVTSHAFTIMALSAASSGVGYDIALHDNAGNPVALTLTSNYGYYTGTDYIAHVEAPSSSYAGILSGSGSLTLSGMTNFPRWGNVDSGTQTLAGANTYTGPSTLIYGTLNLANQNAVQNSTMTMNGGTLTFDKALSGHAFTLGGLAGTSSGPGYDIALHDTAATPNAVAVSVGNNNADTSYAGVLSGAGSVVKIGTGTLTLSGANTYSGGTTVNTGILTLSGANTSSGVTTITGGTLNVSNQNAVQNSTVTLNGGGLVFDSAVAGHAFTFGGLASSLEGPAYRITLEDNASTPDAVALSVGNNHADTLFAGSLMGDGSLIKTGSGTLTLSGQNTYKGVTTLSGGTLAVVAGGNIAQSSSVIVDSATLGTQATLTIDGTLPSSVTSMGDVTVGVSGNGTLTLQNLGTLYVGGRYGTGTLTLASSTGSTGTLNIGNGDSAGMLNAAAVTGGAGTAVVNFNQADDSYMFLPLLTGSLAVNQIGSGTTVLDKSNTHTGATQVNAGTLQVANGNALQNSTLTLGGGSLILDSAVSGDAFTLGGLAAISSGPGYDLALENNAATPNAVALSVGNNNSNTAYVGNLSGPGSLTKIGTGTLALNGANSYSGFTTVAAGTLLVNGSNTGTGAFNVAAGATLGGTGSLAVAVNVSGVLAPGASIGVLTSGALTLTDHSTYQYEVNSSVPVTVGADLQIVNGALNLGSSVTLNLSDLGTGTFATGTVFSLFNYATGSWNNALFTYNSAALADDTPFNFLNRPWVIDYNATTKGVNVAGAESGNYINITATDAYTLWIQTPAFEIPADQQDPNDDPDGDGASNLEEFAFGGIPNDPTHRGLIFGIQADSSGAGGAKQMILTIAVRNSVSFSSPVSPAVAAVSDAMVDGLNYTILGSSDLTDWTMPVTPAPVVNPGLPTLPTGYQYVSFVLSGSDGLPARGFLRAMVERP